MEVHAKLRFLRVSPRKVRLVIDAIRGLQVDEALIRLSFIPKAASEPVKKLLESAIANAEHNYKLKRTDLFVKTITADGGPMIKRWRPRAFGRAAPIRKRTSHVQIVLAPLSEKPEDKNAKRKAMKAEKRAARRDSWQKKKAARHALRDAKHAPAKPVEEKKEVPAEAEKPKNEEKPAEAKKPAAKEEAAKKDAAPKEAEVQKSEADTKQN